jgi:trk system potassium uptake protein TrkA
VLAITPNDQDNLVICQLASTRYHVPRAIALANDPDNAEVFQKLGITAFSTTEIIGSLIEQRASLERITNLLPVAQGRVNVTEVVLDDSCPVVGRHLREVRMPENALVGIVTRGETPIVPRGSTRLEPGDRVVLLTLPENHGEVLRILTGE